MNRVDCKSPLKKCGKHRGFPSDTTEPGTPLDGSLKRF